MYQEAKQIIGKRPEVFISDGAANFHDAYKTDNCASELRQFDCPSDDDIWHRLGFYKIGVVTLCEKKHSKRVKKTL